jgi:two-component system OmpR family response regulator
MRALVAEDDPDIQVILRMVLTRMGKCEVDISERGDEIIRLAHEAQPDFILLDLMLPEMSGYEICKALKADDATKSIPVIFLTARSMPSDIREALSLGALGYLAKPFDPMHLVGQINALLSPVGCTIGG